MKNMAEEGRNVYLVVFEENHIGKVGYHIVCAEQAGYGLSEDQREELERINLEVVAEYEIPMKQMEKVQGLLGKLKADLQEDYDVPLTRRVDRFLQKHAIVTTI